MGNVVLTDELLEKLGSEYQQYLELCDRAGEEVVAASFQVYVQQFMCDAEKRFTATGGVAV